MSEGDVVVRMPKLADTLVEGTLGKWLRQVGARVERGDPLASIETDKVTTELTSPAGGTLADLLVAEGQTVPVETPIARITLSTSAANAAAAAPPAATPATHAPNPPASEPPAITPATHATEQSAAALARPPKPTPLAARLLAAHGLAVQDLPTKGRVRRDDVLAFLTSRPSVTPLSSMRRAIAEHMTRASATIPHGQTVVATDLTDLVAWRDANNHELTFTTLFVYALAKQLAAHLQQSVDIGVAVALQEGLIAPVLRGANDLSLEAVARSIADLANRARANRLQPGETQGAQMTLTNVGSFGNLLAAPIIPLGQLGILGPGLVERRPMVSADGGIRPGWRCLLSFMFDRREFDDFNADRFLVGVANELRAIPTHARSRAT